MEHRVRFRDIPWPMAIAVLPGKIIGTFIIKPILWFKDDPFNASLKSCLGVAIGLLIFISAAMLDGVVFEEKLGVVNAARYVLGDFEEHKDAKRKRAIKEAVAEAERLKEEADRNARAAQTCYKDAHGRCR